jgi:Skp family chaperone for outer membrane proteins
MKKRTGLVALVTAACCLALTPTSSNVFAQAQGAKVSLSAAEQQLVSTFEKRVKEYVSMREGIEGKMPKLSKDAKPEQIEAHKVALQKKVQAARQGAKQGDIFTPAAVAFIRATIKDEFKGRERQELRKEVLVEAENKAVPVAINQPYPETQELLEMPPTLLLRLPQLPKQVKYRFVRNHLLLVDRENGLIIDYMTDALP